MGAQTINVLVSIIPNEYANKTGIFFRKDSIITKLFKVLLKSEIARKLVKLQNTPNLSRSIFLKVAW